MLILASASPRRQELISIISKDVKVIPANVSEDITDEIPAEYIPEHLSVRKAAFIAKQYPTETVIGCDTSVIVNGEILGKPTDDEDAVRMLKLLSNKTHKVITGCAIFKGGRSISFSETTYVTFLDLSDDDINEYLKTNEHKDKAGAYGIQGYASLFISKIEGDYFNVVGLPVARLNRVLKKF